MANEIDQVDESIVEEDLSKLDEFTDWKAKAEELEQKRREDGIRSRERTKALKAQLEESKAKPTEKPSDVNHELVELAFLKASGLTDPDVIQLARDTAKKWDESLAKVVDDPDFKVRAERIVTTKANATATDIGVNRRGDGVGANSVEYWLSRIKPDEPMPDNVPKEIRGKVVAARRSQQKDSRQFYND